MKLRLHHIDMCVSNVPRTLSILCDQFGLTLTGQRETATCHQYVAKLGGTTFVITSRKNSHHSENHSQFWDSSDHWSLFCCENSDKNNNCGEHIDSVFNVALEVRNLVQCMNHLVLQNDVHVVKNITRVFDTSKSGEYVDFAVVKSCCGNLIHTLIEKKNYSGEFLPGFHNLRKIEKTINKMMTHFDHIALACRVGETDRILKWYEKAFGMKRFFTNSQDSEQDGLVIGDDVGLRLKVLQFWRCSESGLATENTNEWDQLKIVVAESLPNISNTQIENFIHDHGGAGLQHVGLYASDIILAVKQLATNGVKFRHPPPTYYTEVGQLKVIEEVGENVENLKELGILLDNEADVFDDPESKDANRKDRYLMQVFTHPIFEKDTFFLEIIHRKGARGFGVGNVTALARSINAYQEQMKKKQLALEESIHLM